MDNQNYNYTPAPQVVNAPDAKTVMILGIVALALAELGLPGLILAIIAKNKAKQWSAAYGPFTGMAKVGNILARVALPLSIVMMVVWAIYCIAIVAAAIMAGLDGAAHYSYLAAALL